MDWSTRHGRRTGCCGRSHVMLRTRYLWFLVVSSVIYVLLVFVLHRHLHRINVVPRVSDGAATNIERPQWTDVDNASNVSQPPSLTFPVIRPCVGPSIAPPSRLLPLGPDWLYTAYFDDRLRLSSNSPYDVTYIRVLALLHRRSELNRKPTFYFRWSRSETGNTTTTAAAEMYEMCENHGRRYGGWILSAKFTDQLPPCSIVVTHQDRAGHVRLPVFRMTACDENNFRVAGGATIEGDSEGSRRRADFAVCVPPLYGAITASTLVQFVELTRLLGATQIIFYVSRVSEPVQRFLNDYQAEDMVTLIPWILPSSVTAQSIWYNGQLLAVNDCLYRTSHAFNYVAFNDLDEFIVPHSAANWSLMIEQLMTTNTELDHQRSGQQSHRQRWSNDAVTLQSLSEHRQSELQSTICGFTFRSAFFQSPPLSFQSRRRTSMSFHSNVSAAFDKPSYDVLSWTHRSSFSRVRSKVIVRPNMVFELGIHHISRPLYSLPAVAPNTRPQTTQVVAPVQVMVVPTEVAFVHHYRDCTNDYEYELDCHLAAFVDDDWLTRAAFIATLIQRVRVRLSASLQQLYSHDCRPMSTAGQRTSDDC